MYTRYELYLGFEPQDVGFIFGLNELGLSDAVQDELLDDFNKHLTVPYKYISEEQIKQRPLAYFTSAGLVRFKKSINKILRTYKKIGFFEIEKVETSLSDKTIIYQDEYQVLAI